MLENRISNKMLEDNFQRVVTLSDQPPAVALAATPGASAPQPSSLANAVTTGQPAFVSAPPAMDNKPKSSPGEVVPTQEGGVSPKQVQRIQMLQQLADLKKAGALTEEEFAKEKAKLLSN